MALTITHQFVSGVADDPAAAAAGEVLPSQWDAAHVIGTGGVDQAIFFDQAGAFGQDTNLEWDYTNHILNLGPNARLNSVGTTWRFDVGGTNKADFGITNGGLWTFQPFIGAADASSCGFFAKLTGDAHSEVGFEIDTSGHPYVFFGGAGTFADTHLNRMGVGTVGVQNTNQSNPAGLQVYNISDNNDAAPIANYERGVFDWTTTSNVLTIGTQKGGSGATRNIQLVAGNSAIADYGITGSGAWNFPVSVRFVVSSGSSILASSDGNSYGSFSNAPMQLVQNTSVASGISLLSYGTGNNQSSINLYYTNTNSGPNSNGALGSGQWLGSVFFIGNDGSAFANGAYFHAEATQVWTNAAHGSKLVFTTTANGSTSNVTALTLDQNQAAIAGGSVSASGDTGGIASTNTISSANSTTISTGTGTVKMSSANNANNTGWLKCYIGTQVAWIPCWTTNAP